jgi:hypothetical protein
MSKEKKKFKLLKYNSAIGVVIWDRKNRRPIATIPPRDKQRETEKIAKICWKALNKYHANF